MEIELEKQKTLVATLENEAGSKIASLLEDLSESNDARKKASDQAQSKIVRKLFFFLHTDNIL